MTDTTPAESRIIEGELTAPLRETLPRPMEPAVTMTAVQRYVEAERRRSRRILVWTCTIFTFVVLLILALFVSVGIFVIKHTRATAEQVGNIQTQTSAYAATVTGFSSRIRGVEDGRAAVEEGLRNTVVERRQESRVLKSNLERFSRWVSMEQSDEVRRQAALEARMKALEDEARQRESALLDEISVLREDYSNLVMSVTERAESLVAGYAAASNDSVKEATEPVVSDWDEALLMSQFSESAWGAGPLVSGETMEDGSSTSASTPLIHPPPSTLDPLPSTLSPPSPRPAAPRTKVVTFPNGDRYEGEVKDGVFEGWGIYYYQNGDRYEGEFRNDFINGTGTYFSRNGDVYIGEFRNEMKEGQGKFSFRNGDRYVGAFRDDTMNGKGVMTYRDGSKYSGDFLNGLKHGNGVFEFVNGDVYKGEFQNDVRQGRGTYLFADGAKYTGEFQDGRRHGQGRYLYAGGEEYEGDFRDGKKHGRGTCVYPNGDRFEGAWEDDRFVAAAE